MWKFHHQKTSRHLSNIEEVDSSVFVVDQFGVVEVKVSEFSHSEILPIDVLNLGQRLVTVEVSADLKQEYSAFSGFSVTVVISIDEHDELVGRLKFEDVESACS